MGPLLGLLPQVKTLLTRLSAARAGYIDAINSSVGTNLNATMTSRASTGQASNIQTAVDSVATDVASRQSEASALSRYNALLTASEASVIKKVFPISITWYGSALSNSAVFDGSYTVDPDKTFIIPNGPMQTTISSMYYFYLASNNKQVTAGARQADNTLYGHYSLLTVVEFK